MHSIIISFLVPLLSAKGRKVVQDAQAFYRNALIETIHRTEPNPIEASKRLSSLLALLPPTEVSNF
jgi:hypothetical protein